MKKVLFVCYGSGHVRMVLPVARALRESGIDVAVLGLTTAAQAVREAGLPLLQFADFLDGGDEAAAAHGRRLLSTLPTPPLDERESVAYLGLSYADLEAEHGAAEAAARHAQLGRQAFLPVRTLRRILEAVRPDLVVATNSPRAERAAIAAARGMGIPSLCIVDLFAIDEVRWIGRPDYADRVCVLDESVRRFLIDAGRAPDQVVVTGNPAFDALLEPAAAERGQRLRASRGWGAATVVLWPIQAEPAVHPFDGRTRGDATLPDRALQAVLAWVLARDGRVLCVRPRAGDAPPALPVHPRVAITGQDVPLPELLHAVDIVATLTSTVGLEGHLAGKKVLQVLGSMFDAAMPLQRHGMADMAVPVAGIGAALDALESAPARRAPSSEGAAARVVGHIRAFL